MSLLFHHFCWEPQSLLRPYSTYKQGKPNKNAGPVTRNLQSRYKQMDRQWSRRKQSHVDQPPRLQDQQTTAICVL